jgi:hypothetical protein
MHLDKVTTLKVKVQTLETENRALLPHVLQQTSLQWI